MENRKSIKRSIELIKESNHNFGLTIKDNELERAEEGDRALKPRELLRILQTLQKRLQNG